LLTIKDTTFEEIDKIIKEVIISIEYSPENYIKLLEENKHLKEIIEERKEINKTNEVLLLTSENKRLKEENIKLLKKYNKNNNTIKTNNSTFENEEVTQEELENYPITMNNLKRRVYTKTNGTYNINGKIFESLYGSREQVWEEKSYKTSGGLIKNDLMINKLGKIVSKKKSIHEFAIDRFTKCGVNNPK
jgi:hypothetical protein